MKTPIRGIRQFFRKSASLENLTNNKSLDDNNPFKKSQNSEISFEFSDDDLKNSSMNNSNFNISSSTNKSITNQKANNQIPKIPNYPLETIKNKNEKISIDYYSEDIPLDSLKISKTEKEVSNLNTLNQINEASHEIKNNNIQINNLSLNKRLLEKIKEVKSLEESLKEKNKIIEKQKSEIEKLSTELKKKNVKINI